MQFKAVRSSGAGGQNVNKVSSKVVLSFDLKNSQALSDEEKVLLETKLSSRLTLDTILILNCDEDRSQLKNKAIVTRRFLDIITAGLVVPKIRKATKIPKSVIRKRIFLCLISECSGLFNFKAEVIFVWFLFLLF